MSPPRNAEKVPKRYLPDEVLLNYMRDWAPFEARRIKQKLRGPDLTSDPEYEPLKKRKAKVVEKVFKSMANLVFFFECLAVPYSFNITPDQRKIHKELQDLFEDDVKDLLGIRRANSKDERQKYAFLFERLIQSLIFTGDGVVDETDYFRLKLIHILQDNIYYLVHFPLSDDFSSTAFSMILEDVGRAKAWTELLAKKAHDEDDDLRSPRNTIDFPSDLSLQHIKGM